MVRRRRNTIDGLYVANGNWCENSMDLKAIVVDHFKSLFFVHEELDTRFLIPLLFPSLDQNLLVHLDNVIKPKEVKYSLFHIGGLKSPGFDGYPGHFFQVHWNLVGAEITNVVTQAFR